MDETVKSELIDAVISIARSVREDVHLGEKYGGTVFMMDPDAPGSFVGGVFASKAHVSVEFSNGADFSDPNGVLDGKGKARRHVKLHGLGDVDDKDVAGFLAQAFGA
ncbi:DUF1801 domain-containing protein [Octadecabacter sp. G9-8]|uniref:DUF1801 domain-containing protein n=1 Tax=Octadecabacter dasysiphoniae TaxID=2909341 RepID=A0ABS9CSL3_9RHOB|nr:DUF1801 domain-containing protein [Octadecabacter dasysiphoniae]MCF2870178.1 DUF1801 domain-containing protein [Octadecabacter dasysiphoniae]